MKLWKLIQKAKYWHETKTKTWFSFIVKVILSVIVTIVNVLFSLYVLGNASIVIFWAVHGWISIFLTFTLFNFVAYRLYKKEDEPKIMERYRCTPQAAREIWVNKQLSAGEAEWKDFVNTWRH